MKRLQAALATLPAFTPTDGAAVEASRAVAASVGATVSEIHLGRDASVTTVKRLRLADYRIVYFATHALVAGDIRGLGEPALALTLPEQPSAMDSGLLTASEVTELKLNADHLGFELRGTVGR